jgi:hypothetical protein
MLKIPVKPNHLINIPILLEMVFNNLTALIIPYKLSTSSFTGGSNAPHRTAHGRTSAHRTNDKTAGSGKRKSKQD